MNTTAAKMSISAALAAVGATLGAVVAPFLVLCVLMAADYCTGLTKSWQTGTLSSRTGIKGFVKKLSYGFAVIASVGVDIVVNYCCALTGRQFGYHPMFVLLAIAWLSVNECISILENLKEIGVPLPNFLIKAAKRLKDEVDKEGGDGDGEDGKNEKQ